MSIQKSFTYFSTIILVASSAINAARERFLTKPFDDVDAPTSQPIDPGFCAASIVINKSRN